MFFMWLQPTQQQPNSFTHNKNTDTQEEYEAGKSIVYMWDFWESLGRASRRKIKVLGLKKVGKGLWLNYNISELKQLMDTYKVHHLQG